MNVTTITPADLPTSPNFDVRSSTFFQHHTHLPSPSEVRAQARAQFSAGTYWGWKTRGVTDGYNSHPTPAVFEFENILVFVKWGSDVRISEAQTLYAMKKSGLGDSSIPVPENYGWRKDGDEMFLYMEAVRGKTLEEAWDKLDENERGIICGELKGIVANLRQLVKQDPADRFIGNITKGNYYERALWEESQPEAGPFLSVKEFNDWFIQQYKRRMPDPETVAEPYREYLPDDCEIVYTHGDLHRSNIIVGFAPLRVAALIDWEQSAWLPVYWEECKAHGTANQFSEWAVKWLPLIMGGNNERAQEAWWYYTNPVGC